MELDTSKLELATKEQIKHINKNNSKKTIYTLSI